MTWKNMLVHFYDNSNLQFLQLYKGDESKTIDKIYTMNNDGLCGVGENIKVGHYYMLTGQFVKTLESQINVLKFLKCSKKAFLNIYDLIAFKHRCSLRCLRLQAADKNKL